MRSSPPPLPRAAAGVDPELSVPTGSRVSSVSEATVTPVAAAGPLQEPISALLHQLAFRLLPHGLTVHDVEVVRIETDPLNLHLQLRSAARLHELAAQHGARVSLSGTGQSARLWCYLPALSLSAVAVARP